eukprot:TCONS_00068881-protein
MSEPESSSNKTEVGIPSSAIWIGLSFFLFFATFGIFGTISLLIYILLFIAGFSLVIWNWSVEKSSEILSSEDQPLLDHEDKYCGIPAVFKNIEKAPQGFKYDKRMTGSSCIDEVLQEVIQYFFRDYINYWYYSISDDERFLYELRQVIQKCIIGFASRTKEVEWVPFLTTRMVDEVASHLRIYRKTRSRLDERKEQPNYNSHLTADEAKVQNEIDLESLFFEVESEVVKGVTRRTICLDGEGEQQYLQDISEVLLYLLLPAEDFQNKTVRFFLREIIATSVLLPTVNMICDPDYVNQTISWLCAKETTFTAETFLTTIRFCDDIDDLEETKRKVDIEIAKLRSHDSHGSESNQSEASMKKNMNSLMYVRKLCITTIRSLKSGSANLGDQMMSMENEADPNLMELLSPHQNIPKLSLKEILEDNTALSYFIEYMGSYNAEHYIFFHLTVEGFRATAIQQLTLLAEETAKAQDKKLANPNSENFEQLKQAALNIYEEYISPKASPRIVLDDGMVRKIIKDIKSNEPSGAYFDAAHMAVYKILEGPKYYGAFLSSTSYLKCLFDLDMLNSKDDEGASDDDTSSTISTTSVRSTLYEEETTNQPWTPDCDLRYSALIGQAGVVTMYGKSYVNYTVHVCRTTGEGSRNWIIMRRYSDFHDLHLQLIERYQSLGTWLHLPGKKTFGNMEQEFIEKRRDQLENYIQPLLDTQLLAEHSGMFELVAGFLEQGDYFKGKSEISRRVDHLVKPMKVSLSNVGRAVKNKADSVSKWSGDLTDSFKSKEKFSEKDVSGKLSEALVADTNENIPLRILLLLMDEVFDLQDRNQWLRRRIVVILRQIIKAIFGDGINRKIVEHVDFSTSSQQIAEYVKQFRDSYWPGGVLAEENPERPSDAKRRLRMVTKAKMLGSIPDELKRFLGTENVREGVSRVFDMFQHVNLNRRLFYVLFEAFLDTTFADNKFNEIFKKIHETNSKKSS